jgi:hypothetical protein
MVVDSIGKFPVSGTAGSVESTGAQQVGERAEFTIQSTHGPNSSSSVAPSEGDLVSRLQAGQLTKDEYLDLRAAQAVRHLEGQLPTEKIDVIRAALREQLNTDPLLIAMVRRATSTASDR